MHYFPRYEDGSNTFVKETYHTNIINRIKENTQMGPKGVGINACIARTGYITYVQDISKERYKQVLDVLPSLSEKMCKWLQCVSVYALLNSHKSNSVNDISRKGMSAQGGTACMDNLISNIVAKLISCGESSIHLTDCTGITLASNTIKYLQKHDPAILNDLSSDGNILNGEVNFKYLKPKNLPSIAFHWKKKCGFEYRTGTYPRFEISGTNLTISIRSVAHRRFLKPLNRLFPPTSGVDNRHMTLHLADFICYWKEPLCRR
jgi:hypothetical protein